MLKYAATITKLLIDTCWCSSAGRKMWICFNEIASELAEEVEKGYVIENLDVDHHNNTLMACIWLWTKEVTE